MDHSKESINEQESLKIIHEMIDKAKNDLGKNAFYPILWGWIVLIGSLSHYLLLKFTTFEKPWLVWSIVIIGIIGSAVKGYKDNKKSGAQNYSSNVTAVIWVVFLINYFILIPFVSVINFMVSPIILLMTGGSLVISGFVVKFKPFYFGGIFTWLMTITAFLFPFLQLLASAAAALFGILIPGYILKNREEK